MDRRAGFRGLEGLRWLVAVVGVAAALVLGAGNDGPGPTHPPANGAARLVPADALVYVHLSTDRDREATRRAGALADRFPSWPALRDGIVRQLSAPGCRVSDAMLRDADEVALALFDVSGGTTANSLVLVDTGSDHARAERHRCGMLSAAYVGRFLAIGQPESLDVAQRLQRGDGAALADAAAPRREMSRLPADRVADGWVSRDGVLRLLVPQGGLLGAAGVLFDQPALRGAAFGLTAEGDDRARITVKTQLDPAVARRSASGFKRFSPTLADDVPASAMAYLGVSNIAPALQRLAAAAGSGSAQVQSLVKGLDPALLKVFRGEAAVILTPHAPAPILTLLARTGDEAATRRALGHLPAGLRRQLTTAVFDGKVAVSTSEEGIRAVRDDGQRLVDTDQWRKAAGDHPDVVSSLVFLDFSRLLTLAEQTGLDESPSYRSAKADLAKVQAIGAHTSGNPTESTAEISLLISS
jgi:hypothetical protein